MRLSTARLPCGQGLQGESLLTTVGTELIPALLYWNTGNIHTPFMQSIFSPTGSYDVSNGINHGLNRYESYKT